MKIIQHPIAIITGIFLVKLFSVLYLVNLTKCITPESFSGLARIMGDTDSYIVPIDNYINEGSYYYETSKAGRMPYLGLVYYPWRLLFSKPIALSIVVILQTLLGSFAIFYMAKLCQNILKNVKAFWLFIFLSCISFYVTTFDYCILSESFGISFICLFTYHYYNFLTVNRSNKQLVIAGFFLALTILFKPYMSLLFLLIGIEFLYFESYHQFAIYAKNIIKNTVLVSLPLIILSTPWTVRNYNLFGKFIPFQQDIYAGYGFTPAYFAAKKFMQAIGESFLFWEQKSPGCYFEPRKELPCEYQFPERVFSDELTMNKIEEVRDIYVRYQQTKSDSLQTIVVEKFNTLTDIYKRDHPFFYNFCAPIRICKLFLFHSGTYYFPIKKGSPCYHPFQWVLKLSQSIMYYLCLIFGFIGTVLLVRQNKNSLMLLAVPLYLILLFPIILRGTEFRYFHMAYPFLLIGLTNMFFVLGMKIKNNFIKN